MPATVASRQVRRYCSALVAVAIALLGTGMAGSASSADPGAAAGRPTTASPIKHVIVVIGENQSFDHLYGTHVPPSGDLISNLLVKGIVRPDGSPGPYFAKAQQFTTAGQTSYFISVATKNQTRYTTLPAPTLNGAPNNPSPTSPPFTLPGGLLAVIEPSLEPGNLFLLTTGATGAAGTTGPDPRIVDGTTLPNGPFQLTGPNLPYDSCVGDTTHRFYQMWKQSDCSIRNATEDNPSACLNDLYPFVVTTYAGPMVDRGGGN
jgi:phospholipase C